MGILNRRNAFLGWVAWQVAKRVLRRKARGAVPTVDPETKRPNASLILAALAAVAGAVFFWRRRGDGEPGPE
ncbi:MAG: hypothetical protein M3321_11275 [Actinomycetota bacterium]|nr:hypothetical protein [Actinomycetota bacterium]